MIDPIAEKELPVSNRRSMEWAWIGLFFVLAGCLWWRAHTFAPTLVDRLGFAPIWPVVSGETEPLDCDEAAYLYMGRRMNEGAVLYRDLVENKPPLGYWIYALAARIGGANEWTVRLMPLPIVLATVITVWWLGCALGGPVAGCLSACAYVILSADPYLYGNGMQLEQAINLFSITGLAALVWWSKRGGRLAPLLAGALLSGAILIRPSSAVMGLLYVWAALTGRREASFQKRLQCLVAIVVGASLVVATALAVLWTQGVGSALRENVWDAALALVRDTEAPPHAPPWYARWLTGNTDPRNGRLPWPFGQTDWLVWWGTGTWPLWIAGSVGALWLARRRQSPERRWLAAWVALAWVQVVLPRQYWPHYYLLPTPGLALASGLLLVESWNFARKFWNQTRLAALMSALVSAGCLAALAGTVLIQVNDYLMVPSSELTARYKGGSQWITLRLLGRDLGARAKAFAYPKLFVWGWQSPLYVYSGLDSPSRHFFVNDLVKTHIQRPHPLVDRWKAEILADLGRTRPEMVFCGDAPFDGLRDFLQRDYTRSRLVGRGPKGEGLWVERSRLEAFQTPLSARTALVIVPPRAPRGGVWTWLPGVEIPRLQPVPAPAQSGGRGTADPVGDPARRR